MGEIVNLRRARKGRERKRREAEAAKNRVLFGMTTDQRRRLTTERERRERGLEGHRLTPPDDE